MREGHPWKNLWEMAAQKKEPPRYRSEAAPKLKITIKRAQNRARMALPSVSDFGKANVTIVENYGEPLRAHTHVIYYR